MNNNLKLSRYQSVISYLNRINLHGTPNVPLGIVVDSFKESLAKSIIFHRAAAMTYRIFIALIPLFMALFAAISFLGESVKQTILDFMMSITPIYVWPAIEDMITEILTKQNGTLLWFSFCFGLLFAVICINALINILNTTHFRENRRTFSRQLLVVLFILMAWFLIILLAIAVFIGATAGFHYLDNHFFNSPKLLHTALVLLKWLMLFTLVYVFIALLYYLAPANRKQRSFFSAGATLASVAMVLILGAMNYYFANFGNYNVIYGSLGAIMAILLWLYLNALFILIGFDLNASITYAKNKYNNLINS